MLELLKNYPSQLNIPVQWGDMDAAQHVNNTVYLRWMESARIQLFNQYLDFSNFATGNGIGPILAEVSCKYKLPVTFPDQIVAAARVLPDSLTEFGFDIQSIIVSQKHQRIAAEGIARIVCYDYANLCKSPIPAELIAKILAI